MALTSSLPAAKAKPEIMKQLTTKSGKIYYEVEIDKADSNGLAILHQTGCVSIPLDDLPDDLRKKYTDKVEAKAEARKKLLADIAEKKKEYFEKTDVYKFTERIPAKKVSCKYCRETGKIGRSVQVKRPGQFIRYKTVYDSCSKCGGLGYSYTEAKTVLKQIRTTEDHFVKLIQSDNIAEKAEGKVFQSVENGYLFYLETYESVNVGTHTQLFTKRNLIFLSGAKTGLVDNESWKGSVWRIGSYQYTATIGATKTVPQYTADPKIAAKHLKIKD